MKAKHQRLLFVGVSVLLFCIAAIMALRAFRENLIFFYSPSELTLDSIDITRKIRIGGLVEPGSLNEDKGVFSFAITDGKADIRISYKGILPNLFREGQGVIAEGYLRSPQQFEAQSILAKHDETYMPKEVMESLKRSGRWKGSPAP